MAKCVSNLRFPATSYCAVPTTDLPLHKLPKLLDWFNGAMAGTLAPLLASKFGFSAKSVRAHDAFIVKYTAGAQAPLLLVQPIIRALHDYYMTTT